jgi:ribosomal protein S18 acetylase RimI-like enzyme
MAKNQSITIKDLSLRRLSTSDVTLLQKISIQTFRETYEAVNTPENMALYIENNLGTEQLTDELLNPKSHFNFLEYMRIPIGFFKLNFIPNDKVDPQLKGLEIERIYLIKEHQDKGIGQFIMNEIYSIAVSEKLDYIWLGVWENNVKAREFYSRNGFVEFGWHVFYLGKDKQNDILVWKRINAYET